MKLTTFLIAAVVCAAPAFAGNITLPFNTGVMADRTVAAGGSVDMHYTAGDSTVYVEGAPVNGAWIGSDSASAWIGPDTVNGSSVNNGYYTLNYAVNFDLTGYNPSSVTLTGLVASDNTLNDIEVNGASTGITAPGFSSWTPFTINSNFVSGLNTIDFNYTNAGGPGGLRVEFTGAEGNAVSPAPEPASLALLGFGVAGLGFIRRYRTSK